MIILNIYGDINPILISKKLGISLANLPDDWVIGIQEDIEEEIYIRRFDIQKIEKLENYSFHLKEYNLTELIKNCININNFESNNTDKDNIGIIAKNLIGIFVNDFENSLLKLKNDILDSPTCEKEYCDKFLKFCSFVSRSNSSKIKSLPISTYCSDNYREKPLILNYMSAMSKSEKKMSQDLQINNLIKFGDLIDNFLKVEKDFWRLDYILNSIFYDNEYNSFHLFKTYSLIEMLIINPKNCGKTKGDISKKLSIFLNGDHSLGMTAQDKKEFSEIVRVIRNKIGHGDFKAVGDNLKKYECSFMQNFSYDEFEHNRENWNYISICCKLDEALQNILWLMLTDRKTLEDVQFDRVNSIN